ncbi:MAG: protoporphyrinogen oxidase, partial [Candidatus Binatia bacterium]
VVATPADAAARLLRALAPAAAEAAGHVEQPPLSLVSLAYRRAEVPASLRGFGFLVPRGQGVRLLGCLFVSSIFPGRAADEEAVLTTFVGGATDPEGGSLDADGAVRVVREGLVTTLGIRATPKVLAVTRYERSIPQYTLGHRRRIAALTEATAKVPGLFVTGNYFRGVSVGDCIRHAGEASDAVVRYLG